MKHKRDSRLPILLAAIMTGLAGFRAAADPPLGPDEGRPAVLWDHADEVVGRTAFVYGQVVDVGHTQKLNFLNFAPRPQDAFTAVIPAAALAKFKPDLESLYLNKFVRVRGLVKTYRGHAEIEVADPAQVQVLDKLPELKPLGRLRTEPMTSVTVATFNILNLFDDFDDPDRADEGTEPKPKAQMERVAKAIRELNADVVALEEIETREYLHRFVDAFLPDLGYQVVEIEGNDPRGIDVAVLSRVPVGAVTSHRHLSFPDATGKPSRFKRDLLSVTIEPPGGEAFDVWVVHLQSNYEGKEYAEPVRLGEARKVRSLLDQRLKADPKARILIMGDFNDVWESAGVKAIVGDGATALKCFAEELPTDARITYSKEPYRSMIDFILATPAMAERYMPGTYRIIAGSEETLGSDHCPVSAKFKTGMSEPAPERN
ncbi:MAG: endonuclease/exonuclease/phosphatase family protein [Phycisphaerales bacterium]|nr:endonuclease/exonuclease/phosphatase family protein [Phycisphaerales bacterium]